METIKVVDVPKIEVGTRVKAVDKADGKLKKATVVNRYVIYVDIIFDDTPNRISKKYFINGLTIIKNASE